MNVVHVSQSDSIGGANRAAYRIHRALEDHGIGSTMLVANARRGDRSVVGPATAPGRVWAKARRLLGLPLRSLLRTANPSLHSPACIPSRWSRRLDASACDVVHLHWINGEMMSIADIGRLHKPVVWKLCDMWAFCGAEHYTDDFRWRDGYTRSNRPPHESGFDLNRWTWRRKRRHWRRPFSLVAPSRWLADCARTSLLLRGWPVTVIPNPIDTDTWSPAEKPLARRALELAPDVPLLVFGALGGGADPRKGFDLLAAAVRGLQGRVENLQVVVFGESEPREVPDIGRPIRYTGHLHDDERLRLLYSAADVVAVPSRLEAFGQTASEAHACGTPVVAFDNTGLADIVDHRKTGYLARAFDVEDLADGIAWVLAARGQGLGAAARRRACHLWDARVVARQYAEVYREAIDSAAR